VSALEGENDDSLPNFALNFNLRRYNKAAREKQKEKEVALLTKLKQAGRVREAAEAELRHSTRGVGRCRLTPGSLLVDLRLTELGDSA
jgi:hypothetical protein